MEKPILTKYDFLFMGNSEGNFVENFAYDFEENGEVLARLFINVEILQNRVDADQVAEIIFESMRRGFFGSLEKDNYDKFEYALKEVNKALNNFKETREDDFLGKLNIIIAIVAGDQLYLTQVGDAEAYLIRKRFATVISEGLDEGSDKEIFTNIASGDLEAGDFVLLSSTRLLRYISKNDLARILHGNLEIALSELKDVLHGEILSKTGMVLIEAASIGGVEKVAVNEPAYINREDNGFADSENLLKDESSAEMAGFDRGAGMTGSSASAKVADLKRKAVKGLSAAKDKFKEWKAKDDLPGRMVAKGKDWAFSNWSKDKILIAFVAILVILGLGIWGMRASAEEQKRMEELNSTLVQIREEVNSAITTGQFDKDRASQMLVSAETKAIDVYNSGHHKAKARELLDLILETRDRLDGVVHVKPEMIADLSAKRNNVSALGLIKSQGRMFAYEYNALYPILGDQVGDPLTIDDNEKVVAAVNYDDQNSVLFLTQSGKLIEYKDDRMSFLSTDDGQFKKGVDIKAFSNRIFILDPNENQIWRYTRRRDKFDVPQAYAVGADLKNGVSMAIDGSIYVLADDGYITKLFQGNKTDFPVTKQPVKPMTQPKKIYSEVDMTQVYVLEPNQNRVLIYLKDSRSGGAVYSSQFIFDEIEGLKDLYVDKNTNTLYLLTESKVYRHVM